MTNAKFIVLRVALVLSTSLVLSATAKAEQFPYRNPSFYRTIFMEAATKQCIRNHDLPDELASRLSDAQFCDCEVVIVATFMTQSVKDEIDKGGVHVTPRYQALVDWAADGCTAAATGRTMKPLPSSLN